MTDRVYWELPRWLSSKASACKCGRPSSIPGLGGLLEEGMATHASILAWRIPWTREPGGLQSVGCRESDTTEASSSCSNVYRSSSHVPRALQNDLTQSLLQP